MNYIYPVALAKIDIFYIFFKMAQLLVRSTRLTHGHPMLFPLFPRQRGEVTAFLNPDGQVAVVVRNLGFQNNSAEAARNRRNHWPSKEFCLWISGCVSVWFLILFGKQWQMAVGCWDAVGCAAWAWRVPGAWCKNVCPFCSEPSILSA